MQTLSEVITKRVSCRTYSDKTIEGDTLHELLLIINARHEGPFGNKPVFKLISMDFITPAQWKKMGTYGVIRNARNFLAGTIKKGPMEMEDYGYCKELIILKATAMGLGTCWLGGTFQSSGFARAISLQKGEILPTVSPIGYPATEKTFTEKIMRRIAGSDQRKPWPELFFRDNFSRPLIPSKAGKYSDALENIRLAPSATNKQPWRILLDANQKYLHFYLFRSASYKLAKMAFLQDIDMGIAMSHFEITVQDQALAGSWQVDPNAPKEKSLDYIVSWQINN